MRGICAQPPAENPSPPGPLSPKRGEGGNIWSAGPLSPKRGEGGKGGARIWLVLMALLTLNSPAHADAPPLKTLDDHFPFAVPETPDAWARRAAGLRRRVAVAVGLHPMPPRPPIDSRIGDARPHGLVRRDGFTVEKVAFESLPGHTVTGFLFRPTRPMDLDAEGRPRPFPAVLSPHGHGGLLQRYSDEHMAEQLQSGGEVLPGTGRMPKIARCAHLARMGCVVFAFDMLGYGNSVQIPYSVAHKHGHDAAGGATDRTQWAIPGRRKPWAFFTTPAEARLSSVMGLQTFNALRALDYLAGLPDVDARRIGITGGSGGGTQSILVAALDRRIAASFVNGMISTSMQGGCVCENAPLLRIGTGNVELAALIAPRPLGMTAADDWTSDMMDDGFPQLRALYEMLGAPDNVLCQPMLQFPHNFNHPTRALMYRWLAKHLGMIDGLTETELIERDFEPLSDAELTVFNEQHPPPRRRGAAAEREALIWMDDQSSELLHRSLGRYGDDGAFETLIRPALGVIFDLPRPEPEAVRLELNFNADGAATGRVQWDQERLSTRVRYQPPPPPDLEVPEDLRETLQDRRPVAVHVVPDLDDVPADRFDDRQGGWWVEVESPEDVWPPGSGRQPMVQPKNLASAAYTFGYNHPVTVNRCGRLLAAVVAIGAQNDRPIHVFADSGTAASALPAVAIAGGAVEAAVVAVDRFRYGDVRRVDDVDFVPGMVKYGDIDAWAAARAPRPLTITGDYPGDYQTALAVYADAGADDALVIQTNAAAADPMDIRAAPQPPETAKR